MIQNQSSHEGNVPVGTIYKTKKSIKIALLSLAIIFVISVLALFFVNIANLNDYFFNSKKNPDSIHTENTYGQDMEESGSLKIPIEIDSPNATSGYIHQFQGNIGPSTHCPVEMTLDLENYTGSEWDPYNPLDLTIVSYDPDSRAIQVVVTDENGVQIGLYAGTLTLDGEFSGTYREIEDGVADSMEMPFQLVVMDNP